MIKYLFITVLFIWSVLVSGAEPNFPFYFVITTNRTQPNLQYYSTQDISYDSLQGFSADTTYTFTDGSTQELVVLYPIPGKYKYTSIQQTFGLFFIDLCFIEPITLLDYPPLRIPQFYTNITLQGTVMGSPVEVWYPLPDSDCCPPHWWYLYNTNMGVYYPYGWGNTDGDISITLDFSLQVPSPSLFDTPQCIPIRQPINHNKRDISLTPMAPVWPDSYSITLDLSNIEKSVYVNALTKSMAVVTTQDNLPNLPNFQYSSIILNGSNTLYTVTQWLAINPPPCILETNSPVSLKPTPKLTRLSTVHAFDSINNPHTYDVHGEGTQLSDIWLFSGNFPIGYYNTKGTIPGTISQVLMWSPKVPDNSKFSLPVECFPKSDMDGKKKRSAPLTAPTFPPGFTMYVYGFVVDSQVSEKVYYYDSTKNFVRFDDSGFTILQRGSDVYRFSVLPQLNPYPCEYYYSPSPVWAPPLLTDFILNVTLQGSPVQVWQAYDHFVPTQYQYWYIDSTTKEPVYIIDSTMVGSKVMYFDPVLPAYGIFDIPPFCFTLSK